MPYINQITFRLLKVNLRVYGAFPACTVKLCDVFEVKNALVKSVYYVTVCAVCSLMQFLAMLTVAVHRPNLCWSQPVIYCFILAGIDFPSVGALKCKGESSCLWHIVKHSS
jgi:hypothetical protein